MSFRAVHGSWGVVFAHLPDLGCGRVWDDVWKVRAPLTCDECAHRMYAKTSPRGLRFFAHAPGAPDCAAANESVEHHLLKLELASAARAAGAHAELEVRAQDGAWRADVLATAPNGIWRVALEAQLAPITDVEITARTRRMHADGVSCCWFSDRPELSWLGIVPSVRLSPSYGQGLMVVEGLAAFAGRWASVAAVPLAQFLEWVFAEKAIPHMVRNGGSRHVGPVVWTSPRYVRTEHVYLAVEERRRLVQEARFDAQRRAGDRRRDEIRQRNAITWANALSEAVTAELVSRGDPTGGRRRTRAASRPEICRALTLLAGQYGVIAEVGWSSGQSRYADGIPLVDDTGTPVAVFDPNPRLVRGEAYLLLSGLLLLFTTQRRRNVFERAMQKTKHLHFSGYRTDFIDGRP